MATKILVIHNFQNKVVFSNIIRSFLHVSSTNYSVPWRKQNRLEVNPNKFGPLTNLPDYTFLDGRPTPLGSNQRKRLIKQREIAQKVVESLSEISFAIDRHEKLKKTKEETKAKILANKLKPKGHLLLKKDKSVENK